MKRDRLISKPTIAVIKDALADICTHSSMQNLFEQYDLEKRPGALFSNKVEHAGAHLDHHDWANPEIVKRLLGLLEQQITQEASRSSSALDKSKPCQRIITVMRDRERYDWDGRQFVSRDAAALVHVADKLAEFDVDSLQNDLRRVLGSVDSDPDDAITAAKSLVEATCRAILSDFGEHPANGVELGLLTKQTLKHLQLLPHQIDDASKGAAAARKVLHSIGTAIQGLGELRNLYGDAHGKKPGAKGLEPRHARMAATFAGALSTFMLETHRQRRDVVT